MLVGYYISTGWRASQLICRNYMIGLEERNAYLEFLQREFNFGAGLANASLIAAGANVTLRALGVAVGMAGNEAFEAYGQYRFLDIDRDAARTLVETAQSVIAHAYLDRDQLSRHPGLAGSNFIFSARGWLRTGDPGDKPHRISVHPFRHPRADQQGCGGCEDRCEDVLRSRIGPDRILGQAVPYSSEASDCEEKAPGLSGKATCCFLRRAQIGSLSAIAKHQYVPAVGTGRHGSGTEQAEVITTAGRRASHIPPPSASG